jgi:hypothetical protein
MTKTALRAIRFWAYPTTIIALRVVVSAFSLIQSPRFSPHSPRLPRCSSRSRTALRKAATSAEIAFQNGNKRPFHNGLDAKRPTSIPALPPRRN